MLPCIASSSGRRLHFGKIRLALVITGVLGLASCRVADVLQVGNPDIINPSDVQSAAGATAVRTGAIARLNAATSGGSTIPTNEGLFMLSGLFADEWINGDSFIARQEVDQRVITPENTFLTEVNRNLQRARLAASQAIALLRQYVPRGPAADVAEMYYVQAYVENIIAEHYCNGIVFSEIVGGVERYGAPITTADAYQRALAHADSGLALVTGTSAADTKIRNALSIVRGRILTNLNRQVEAATAVTAVPTTFKYEMLHSQTTNDNQIWTFNNIARRYSVANSEGGNGLDFVAAGDPRVPLCQGGDAVCKANGVSLTARDDGAQPVNVQLIWPVRDAPVAISSGIEARLIEAEGAYKASDYALFVQKLNQARAEGGVANLPDSLTDPGSNAARENILFRERGFWLFGRGYRVGDLRRLIRQYNRPAASVFPTGPWHKGGNYGADVNFPIPQAEWNNPQARGCTDRAA